MRNFDTKQCIVSISLDGLDEKRLLHLAEGARCCIATAVNLEEEAEGYGASLRLIKLSLNIAACLDAIAQVVGSSIEGDENHFINRMNNALRKTLEEDLAKGTDM